MSHGSSLNIPGWCQSSLLGDNSDGVYHAQSYSADWCCFSAKIDIMFNIGWMGNIN